MFSKFEIIDILRQIAISDLGSWMKAEQIYIHMGLFDTVFMNFLWYILGPLILSIGASIVVLLYLTVRPSGLPPFVYYWVPFIAFGALAVLSWLWYDKGSG